MINLNESNEIPNSSEHDETKLVKFLSSESTSFYICRNKGHHRITFQCPQSTNFRRIEMDHDDQHENHSFSQTVSLIYKTEINTLTNSIESTISNYYEIKLNVILNNTLILSINQRIKTNSKDKSVNI